MGVRPQHDPRAYRLGRQERRLGALAELPRRHEHVLGLPAGIELGAPSQIWGAGKEAIVDGANAPSNELRVIGGHHADGEVGVAPGEVDDGVATDELYLDGFTRERRSDLTRHQTGAVFSHRDPDGEGCVTRASSHLLHQIEEGRDGALQLLPAWRQRGGAFQSAAGGGRRATPQPTRGDGPPWWGARPESLPRRLWIRLGPRRQRSAGRSSRALPPHEHSMCHDCECAV